MASIKDVAKLASVSIGTVSRAYNGYTDIKPETKERIFEAARRLNYTPNVNARNLSSKVSNNLGVLMSGLLDGDDRDNQLFQSLKGIYQFAQKHGYQVSLYAIEPKDQRKHSYLDFCMEHNISGAILHGISMKDPYFKELVDLKIPCVTVDVPIEGKNIGCVTIDNFQASKELMNYVISCNHKEIVIIAGKKDADVTIKRLAGAKEALEEHGIKLKQQSVLYCEFQEKAAYNRVKKYLEMRKKNRATLFFCQSDIMALGVYKAIREEGFSIPDDFSVVGFDGIGLIDYISPALTTVKQDVVKRGYRAAELLTEIIKGNATENIVYEDYELLIQNSVKIIE